MGNERLLLLTLTCYVLIWVGNCDDPVEVRAAEDDFMVHGEKELIEALQEVLQKLKRKQNPPSEKRLGWVSLCDAGEQCAIRKGARFGKVCTCPAGTMCSFSILKCL
ncbi:cocaine- and amphetamine-regulated transcript protein [Trichomycterus rosablanca]|uniref:cocaine- and amphetamine-regulated transcript protein n=1 Tax=Trichomycterus rosablanca TaxID=2290929 RepID=UPI002F358C6A